MVAYAEGLLPPDSPWEAFMHWLGNAVRGSLGLPPIMLLN